MENWKCMSNMLNRAASINLKEIKIHGHDIRLSLKTFETFFEKWKGRPAISMYLSFHHIYQRDDDNMKP